MQRKLDALSVTLRRVEHKVNKLIENKFFSIKLGN